MNNLTSGDRRLRRVATGLQLKLAALWGVLLSPVAGLAAWLIDTNVLFAVLGILALAYMLDISGRLLCLSAELTRRGPIAISTGIQACGAISAVAFGIGVGDVNWTGGLVLALLILLDCQAFAAYFFTQYLEDLARALDSSEVIALAQRTRFGLMNSVVTTQVVLLVVAILLTLTCMLSALSGGMGLGLILPINALILAPLLLLWCLAAGQMWNAYGQSLALLRRAAIQVAKNGGLKSDTPL